MISRYFRITFLLALFLMCFSNALVLHADSAIFFGSLPKFIEEGERITVEVRVRATDSPINALSGIATFPFDLLQLNSVSRDGSIVNIWTQEPRMQRGKIIFEGVVMNPGFQGSSGLIFKATFEAKKSGIVNLSFSEGSVLANDGLGTNLLASLLSGNFKIIAPKPIFDTSRQIALNENKDNQIIGSKLIALPVITDYSSNINTQEELHVKGRGEPGALTKIVFQDVSSRSLGERFIAILQTKKKTLDEVLVNNNENGLFEYVSSKNLLAGVYNATPFFVDTETNVEKPGFGVQLLINDSALVKYMVVAINVLALLIPVVGLVVIIYFIPWYSWRRMRLIKKKLLLEEEKIDMSGHQLVRQEKILDKTTDNLVSGIETKKE